MAEVAALSLAANIFQFLDYGKNFVLTAQEIYKNGVDSIELLSDLHSRSRHLQSVLSELQTGATKANSSSSTQADKNIYPLANKCADTLGEILVSLEKIGLPQKGHKRQAIKKAFQVFWEQSKLESLQQRLNQFRDDLYMGLSVSIRAASRMSLDNQEEILRRLDLIETNLCFHSEELGHDNHMTSGFGLKIAEYVTQRTEQPKERRDDLLQSLISTVYNGLGTFEDANLSRIHLSKNRQNVLQDKFIARLWYPDIEKRESQIHPAHEKTFKWVFGESSETSASWDSLTEWLESDKTIYWITGKPGSGKSTLMRYISQTPELKAQPRCEPHLRKWARKGESLIIACFYFWAAGSNIQTSKVGLFRGLLYQLLKASPGSISEISPVRWELLSLFDEDPRGFQMEELRQMLFRAIKHISATSKIALFIDGLDEFEEGPQTLLETLSKLTSYSGLKMCTASRPWVEFENEFRSKPSLRLEDLTQSDIKRYVKATFQKNQYFSSLQKMQSNVAENLISSIVKKASGVFLWVKLVAASLLAGFVEGDRVEDLETRLAELPADLETLYDRIIGQIEPRYREHATQYFQLMKACKTPPSVLLFSFADEPDFMSRTLNFNSMEFEEKRVLYRLDQIRRRLNSRCKGLLEVTRSSGSLTYGTVQYLHKTVLEFMERPEIQEKFRDYSDKPYDPNIRLLAAAIAVAEGSWRLHGSHLDKTVEVKRCMDYASVCQSQNERDVVALLDHLCEASRRDGQALHVVIRGRLFEQLHKSGHDAKFLVLAIQSMVVGYVKARADKGCCLDTSRGLQKPPSFWRSFLQSTLVVPREHLYPLLLVPNLDHPSSAAMLQAMTLKGADPNLALDKIKGSVMHSESYKRVIGLSPWHIILATIIVSFGSDSGAYEDELRNMSDCARVMINRGAKINRGSIKKAFESLNLWQHNVVINGVGHSQRSIINETYIALKNMARDKSLDFTINRNYILTESGGERIIRPIPTRPNVNKPLPELPGEATQYGNFIEG